MYVEFILVLEYVINLIESVYCKYRIKIIRRFLVADKVELWI